MQQDYVTNIESFVDIIMVDHSHIRITDENCNLHKIRNLLPNSTKAFSHRCKLFFYILSYNMAWKEFSEI